MDDLDGKYVVQLVVTDENDLASAPDEVLSSVNQAPTAFVIRFVFLRTISLGWPGKEFQTSSKLRLAVPVEESESDDFPFSGGSFLPGLLRALKWRAIPPGTQPQ